MTMGAPAASRESEALALWKAAEADFADEKRHRAFIVFCGQTGQLPLAGRLYAARADSSPGDPAIARYRELVVAQAIAAMGAPRRPEGPVGFFMRHKQAILIAFSAVTLVLALLLIRKVAALSGVLARAAE